MNIVSRAMMSVQCANISTTAMTEFKVVSPRVALGAVAQEPAILGTSFAELFTSHQHPTSVGPTGPIMPQYATKILNTMAKSVFLS